MTHQADWYFDFLSPYPYLQMARFDDLPNNLVITPKPVVFAALLNHWGHKGPAEIPAKKRQTYFYTRWLAQNRGLAFAGPPRHPFYPLPLLRLCLSAGATIDSIKIIYEHVWGEGNDGQDEDSIIQLSKKLGVQNPVSAINDQSVKDRLRANTDEAIARGVYGIPTFYCAGELFWGDDATPLFAAFLDDPDMFRRPPYSAFEQVTAAVTR